MELKNGKVAIIGAGSVGSTLAYNLSLKGVVTDIALIDSNREKAEAEILDIKQGASLGKSLNIEATDYAACRDCGIVIVTAGARQKPGESRVDLLERNVAIVKSIVRSVMETGFTGIFLLITNPVDVLTWVTFAESGLPAARVIGSGTTRDSARLRVGQLAVAIGSPHTSALNSMKRGIFSLIFSKCPGMMYPEMIEITRHASWISMAKPEW